MKAQKITEQNKGFSLVELIVSILVSTLVLLSVVAFISVAMNQYRRTGDELNLQVESQIAMNLIHDIVIETQEDVAVKEIEVDGLTYPTLKILAKSSGELYHHLIVLDSEHQRLLFSKVKKSDVSDPFTDENISVYIKDNMLGDINLKRVFLADYATGMTAGTSGNLVSLVITFNCGGRNYIADKCIYIRNYRGI